MIGATSATASAGRFSFLSIGGHPCRDLEREILAGASGEDPDAEKVRWKTEMGFTSDCRAKHFALAAKKMQNPIRNLSWSTWKEAKHFAAELKGQAFRHKRL